MGGFALEDMEDVRTMASAVRSSVESGRMPPWKADPGCNDYQGDFSLTEEEKSTLIGWLDGGMPEGDPSAAVTGSVHAGTQLERTDFTLSMDEAYVPQVVPDDYRCFILDWPETEGTYLTGYKVNPGNVEVVHHVISYVFGSEYRAAFDEMDEAEVGAGYTCYSGPGGVADEDAIWLGAWAPGDDDGNLPNGTGLYVESGSFVIMQVHYNTSGGGAEPALSSMDVMIEDEVERPAIIQPWTNPMWLYSDSMNIPAGETTTHSFTYTPGLNLNIHTASLHMHKLGDSARLWVDRADGSETCLLSDSAWDFDWQRSYAFTDPIEFHDGDALSVECTWTNTTDEDISWGEGTGDEMCLGVMLLTAAD